MNTPRKPALGMTEQDWDRFTPEQNVVHLAPLIGLEAALTAEYGDNWVFDVVDDVYVVCSRLCRKTINPRQNDLIRMAMFCVDEGFIESAQKFISRSMLL